MINGKASHSFSPGLHTSRKKPARLIGILQQDIADDYVIVTGRTTSIRDFYTIAFGHVGLKADDHVTTRSDLIRPAEVDLRHGPAGPMRDLPRRLGAGQRQDLCHCCRRQLRRARRASFVAQQSFHACFGVARLPAPTAGRLTPAWRATSATANPSPDNNTSRARWMCFCGRFLSIAIADNCF